PHRRARTTRVGAENWNDDQEEVDDTVEIIGCIIDELKRFLHSGANLAGNSDDQRDDADKKNRVDWRFVFWMQPREPDRQQPIPARNHGQARGAREMNAG